MVRKHPSLNTFKHAGTFFWTGSIATLGDLVRRDISELLKFRNFGRKSLAELSAIVEVNNLTFGMDVDKYLKDSD